MKFYCLRLIWVFGGGTVASSHSYGVALACSHASIVEHGSNSEHRVTSSQGVDNSVWESHKNLQKIEVECLIVYSSATF